MATTTPPQDEGLGILPGLAPSYRFYLFVGLVGLLVLWLALVEKSLLIIATVPALVGLAGLAPYLLPPRWKRLAGALSTLWMPFLLLVLLFFIEALFGYGFWPHTYNFQMTDLMLAAGLLTYLFAQFRLYGLARSHLPVDRRPRPDTIAGDQPEPRPEATFDQRELLPLTWTVPLLVLGGQVVWWILTASEKWETTEGEVRLGMERPHWRVFALIWVVGGAGILLTGFLKILRMYRLSAAEAGMIAQDSLWVETRGEQRRNSRWLAWVRRKWGRDSGRST
ncbi:MAG TPA: hypothetical protein VKS79_26880 [Gemmataceae bacterium]|nr:hypothetical protein [Gemmataceae bacterium]